MDIPSGSEDEWNSGAESIPETDDDEAPPPPSSNLWMPSTGVDFEPSQYRFAGNWPPQNCLPEGSDPMSYFKYFMTDQILEDIVRESNLYASQKEPAIDLNLTQDELLKFIGTVLHMSCVKIPNTRLYWSSDVGLEPIKRAFCVNRWEQIKNNLHFSENATAPSRNDPEYDRTFKIRPFLEAVRQRFITIPMEENLCVDEQMIPTKGRTSFLQYMKAKPHKWGYKVFALCGKSGIAHDFFLYVGKEQNQSSSRHGNVLQRCGSA